MDHLSSCLQRGQEEMILSHLSTHLRWNMCVHGSSRTSSFSLYCARQMQHSCSCGGSETSSSSDFRLVIKSCCARADQQQFTV